MALSTNGQVTALSRLECEFDSRRRHQDLKMKLFGQEVDQTGMECQMGGDHRQLVTEARVDCLHRALSPDERFVLCSRCAKVVPLKI
jgi:hypothetical protein